MPFINIPSYGAATWKEAVTAVIDLPASGNILGDARVVESTSEIYIWDGSNWVLASGGGGGITDLTGDVTAVGPGSAAATVDFVGGETAADVATSVQDTQAATDLSTPSTLVKRDSGGETSLDGLNLDGLTSGAITLKAADTTTSYTVKMPSAQGLTNSVLQNDGSGNLSWTVPPAPVTAVTGTAPIFSSGGATPDISISQSGVATNGYLSSTDWNTFNNKASYPAFSDDRVLYSTTTGAEWRIVGTGSTTAAYPTDTVIVGRAKPTNLTGTTSLLIGPGAGNALQANNNILAIGKDALLSMLGTAGDGYLAIGSEAMRAITTTVDLTSSGAIAIGYQASRNGTDLRKSCVIGFQAALAGGERNTVIGWKAKNTGAAAYCVVIGDSAGTPAGNESVIIGTNAQGSGANLIAVGASAAGSSFTNSVVIGKGAVLNGNNSIALGHLCLANANEFAIGSSTSQINTMLLGRGSASQTVANAVTLMTMRASGSSNTSMTAGTLTLGGAQGTGNGAGGDVIIATAPAGASGSTTNAHVERIRAKSATEVVVNDTGVDFDFRVEGDADANLLFVDAGTDRVGIGLNNPSVKFEVSGDSSLNGALVVNESGADKDTRIEGDTDVNLVFVDASTDRVGVGTATPAEKLEVNGNLKVSSGDVSIATVGKGLKIATGTNATAGKATGLSSVSTVTINTTAVTASSLIFVQPMNSANTHGFTVDNIVTGTSFDVDFSGNYTGDVAWFIIEPAQP